jgi:CubicO group peptidase (beta-lactamase class C family)
MRTRVLMANTHVTPASDLADTAPDPANYGARRMSQLATYRSRLETMLAELAGAHRVPGAACGVVDGDSDVVVTYGLANLATGISVTPDTMFQLGSITKIHTATLIMQARAAGVVGLDEPVRSQVQEFAVADPGATIEITPRHLLTHTSGIEGDHLVDTGWNPDALQRYVATIAGLGQIHEVDESYSFCNTGFGVAGRLVEEVTGENFDRALRRHLSRPLGCAHTLTLPQHLLLHRIAAGHMQSPGQAPVRQSRWTLTRANGPMGGIVATAADLLAFVRMHLDGGRAADGTDVLPSAAVEAMQEPQAETPLPGEQQALGWTVQDWDGRACLGQDANTFGQRAFLRVVPSSRFAVCLLTNSPAGALVAQSLLPRVVGDLAELAVPATARASSTTSSSPAPVEASDAPSAATGQRVAGSYERLHQRIEVTEHGGLVRLITEPAGVLARLGTEPVTLELAPVDAASGVWVGRDPATGVDELVAFTGTAGEPARAVHVDGRMHRRAR